MRLACEHVTAQMQMACHSDCVVALQFLIPVPARRGARSGPGVLFFGVGQHLFCVFAGAPGDFYPAQHAGNFFK